jgi:predicted transposase YdaD
MTAKDIISRDTLKRLTTDLAKHLLGIDGEAVELLETQNQRVEDRRADLVARMRSSDGSEFLLHSEIANNNKADMALRMLRYYTDIRLAGHAGPIRQFLIYIGTDPLNMPGGIQEPQLLDYRYGLVDMHRVNCAGLLVQDNPDALVLAVLCDFGGREPQEVVSYIVRRLSELSGSDEPRFREYMTMLEILSENRNLRPQVEEAERMLTQIDIERMPSYVIGMERGERRGLERGERLGLERGEHRGLERGRAVEKRIIVRRLLARMDVAEVAGLLGLSPEDVARIAAEDDGTDTD